MIFFLSKMKIKNTLYFMLFKMLLVVWFGFYFFFLFILSSSSRDRLIACLYFIYSIFRHVCDLRTISFKMGDMYKKKSEVHTRIFICMNECMSLYKIKFDLGKRFMNIKKKKATTERNVNVYVCVCLTVRLK